MPVYRYALPDDLAPLEAAVGAVIGGEIGVALFTTATQVTHRLEPSIRGHAKAEGVLHRAVVITAADRLHCAILCRN